MKSLIIREVGKDEENKIVKVLGKIGKKLQDFSFFSRDVQINPLLTAILYENNEGVACGHLAKKNREEVRLEIASVEINKDYFYCLMLKYFLEESKEMKINEIKLSLLKSDKLIVTLCEKFGFKKISERGKKILLKRIDDEHHSDRLQL